MKSSFIVPSEKKVTKHSDLTSAVCLTEMTHEIPSHGEN